MSESQIQNTICSVTPTLCALLGTTPLPSASAAVSDEVIREADRVFGDGHVQRCLVFAPDAMGSHLTHNDPGLFRPVEAIAPLKLSLRAVIPPKTPVCFASMFTGLTPDRHGIKSYEKPVLTCKTIFDILPGEGIRVAIVAVEESSIDLIFRRRKVDYFSEKNDEQVTNRVLTLLEEDRHDFILAYHQDYDDALHRSTPFSEEAMKAAEHHIVEFARLSAAIDRYWGSFNRVILFAPDHGAHIDAENGRGTHCEDIPEDMEVCHYWGFRKNAF